MNRIPTRITVTLMLSFSVLLLLCTQTVRAEEAQQAELPDRFMIRGGYLFVFGADTDIALNGPAGFGTTINYNRTLGGTTDYNGFRIDAAYRFNDRHSLGISYYRLLRDSTRTVSTDLTVNDITIACRRMSMLVNPIAILEPELTMPGTRCSCTVLCTFK